MKRKCCSEGNIDALTSYCTQDKFWWVGRANKNNTTEILKENYGEYFCNVRMGRSWEDRKLRIYEGRHFTYITKTETNMEYTVSSASD